MKNVKKKKETRPMCTAYNNKSMAIIWLQLAAIGHNRMAEEQEYASISDQGALEP